MSQGAAERPGAESGVCRRGRLAVSPLRNKQSAVMMWSRGALAALVVARVCAQPLDDRVLDCH